jgi:hypothetical protein
VSENCTTFDRDTACRARRRFTASATITPALTSCLGGTAPGPTQRHPRPRERARRDGAAPIVYRRTAPGPEINNGYEYLARAALPFIGGICREILLRSIPEINSLAPSETWRRRDVSTDWVSRDDVRAKLRSTIKRLLARYRYPPDAQPTATELVLRQMETFAEEWSPNAHG